MNGDPQLTDASSDDALPVRLREDSARLDNRAVEIPREIDARILSNAKSGFARRTRLRPIIRWTAAIASLAAAVAIVFVVRAAFFRPVRNLAKGDITGNGKVDMLDAYVLAKKIAAGEKLDPKWDMNGDGVVDQADVDWIASAAVRIDPSNNIKGTAQ